MAQSNRSGLSQERVEREAVSHHTCIAPHLIAIARILPHHKRHKDFITQVQNYLTKLFIYFNVFNVIIILKCEGRWKETHAEKKDLGACVMIFVARLYIIKSVGVVIFHGCGLLRTPGGERNGVARLARLKTLRRPRFD